MKHATCVLATLVLLIALPAVADSGPSLRSLDHRERQHYKQLDKRLRLLGNVVLAGPRQHVQFENMIMTQNSTGARYYQGDASCPAGYLLTGGGTDWGIDQPRGDWVVNYSHPTIDGDRWTAGLFAASGAPSTSPRVYAVCLASP